MLAMESETHRRRTLWLCGILHAFTHIYQVTLLPLYLLIQIELQLPSVEKVTLLVTVLGMAYFIPSYPLGILADKYSRKRLMTIGLIINSLGFIGLSLISTYPQALFCIAIAGFGGSFYHPSATALIARLFPNDTGKALGWVGVGASCGFFVGPLYAGWRAEASGWRAPVLELGILGLVAALVFQRLAQEQPVIEPLPSRSARSNKLFPRWPLLFFFLAASFAFSLRDFAGSGMGTLTSLFLPQAHGFSTKATGLALAGMFLASAISNPFFGGLSERSRMRRICSVLLMSALAIWLFPWVHSQWAVILLFVYGFFFLSSYPMVEAALMQSVDDSVRGRVFGLFITIAGLCGNLAHWVVGHWVKTLGMNAYGPEGYYVLYAILALLLVLSLTGLPFLNAIRKQEEAPLFPKPFSAGGTGVV